MSYRRNKDHSITELSEVSAIEDLIGKAIEMDSFYDTKATQTDGTTIEYLVGQAYQKGLEGDSDMDMDTDYELGEEMESEEQEFLTVRQILEYFSPRVSVGLIDYDGGITRYLGPMTVVPEDKLDWPVTQINAVDNDIIHLWVITDDEGGLGAQCI